MDYLLLLIGFVLLIKGADFFVEGSSSIARLLRVPSVIIGLTIVAMGTSAHAVGTAKALEMGEIEGAMSSLSIAVAGLMTVIVVPLAANLI